MVFNTEVVGAYWQQETGEWLVKLKQTMSDGSTKLFDDRCHLFLYGSGILNNFKWPIIEGMEKFKGKVRFYFEVSHQVMRLTNGGWIQIMHTARWPKDYQAEEWKKDRVAIIGSGASSIQTVPTMQPHVKHMDIFVRTGTF